MVVSYGHSKNFSIAMQTAARSARCRIAKMKKQYQKTAWKSYTSRLSEA